MKELIEIERKDKYGECSCERAERYLDLELVKYAQTDEYPFHMPGHKRRPFCDFGVEKYDITEIEGFDDLHHPTGIIEEAQRRMAKTFGARESFLLVNGSTAGILAAVCALTRPGDVILMARNSHISAYHAASLMRLKTEYIYPCRTGLGIAGSIDPDDVGESLKRHPDTAAVFITSPTYDGVTSDIESIARIVHESGIPLIVDEAHGAHFGFSPMFPEKAHTLGADICIESLHKTLPAYTQSAVLHLGDSAHAADSLGSGHRVDTRRLRRYLQIFQTSSPSYLLMGSADRCVRMLCEEGAEIFAAYEKRLRRFYQGCASLKNIKVLPGGGEISGIWYRDPSKILISPEDPRYAGRLLGERLRNIYRLRTEMTGEHFVLALSSAADTDEGFRRLLMGLAELDAEAAWIECPKCGGDCAHPPGDLYPRIEKRMEIDQALDEPGFSKRWDEAEGEAAAEYVYLYPPGVPLIVPGEIIDKKVIEIIMGHKRCGTRLLGIEDPQGERILITACSHS